MMMYAQIMQRIRDAFRKRQSTVDSPGSSRQPIPKSPVKAVRSVPCTPKSTKGATSTDSNIHYRSLLPLPIETTEDTMKASTAPDNDSSTAQALKQFKLTIPLECDASKREQRSVSFDETANIQELLLLQSPITEEESPSLSPSLEVPSFATKSARSKSFDAAALARQGQRCRQGRTSPGGSFLEIPKWRMFIRRSSAGVTSGNSPVSNTGSVDTVYMKDCVHCVLLEELEKARGSTPPTSHKGSFSSQESHDAEYSGCDGSESEHWPSRSASASGESIDGDDDIRGCPSPIPMLILSMAPDPGLDDNCTVEDLGSGITVVSLEVPILPKSGRSASVDCTYLKVPDHNEVDYREPTPGKTMRSRSVDIALPEGPDGPYIVVPHEKPALIITQ